MITSDHHIRQFLKQRSYNQFINNGTELIRAICPVSQDTGKQDIISNAKYTQQRDKDGNTTESTASNLQRWTARMQRDVCKYNWTQTSLSVTVSHHNTTYYVHYLHTALTTFISLCLSQLLPRPWQLEST